MARARRGEGPTLIEAETYRFRGHSLADPDELRDPKEKAKWNERDPIPKFRKQMIEYGWATEEEVRAAVWVLGWGCMGVEVLHELGRPDFLLACWRVGTELSRMCPE